VQQRTRQPFPPQGTQLAIIYIARSIFWGCADLKKIRTYIDIEKWELLADYF